MSIQAMAFALEQQEIKDATARHVLLCLANYADKDGRGAFPSSTSLSQDTGLSLRTIKYKLDYLLDSGVIRLGKQAIAAAYIDRHDRRPVVYDIAMERGANGDNEQVTGCSSQHNGVQMATERGAGAAPNPSYNHQLTDNPCRQQADDPAMDDGVTYATVQKAYNDICGHVLPKCAVMNESRKRQIRKMCQIEFMGSKPFTAGIEVWRQYFTDCLSNPHWCGQNDRNWTADFDFVTKPANAIKLMERMN